MAVDIPFESVQEITLKLARYKELLKYHYTEKDEGYKDCEYLAWEYKHVLLQSQSVCLGEWEWVIAVSLALSLESVEQWRPFRVESLNNHQWC